MGDCRALLCDVDHLRTPRPLMNYAQNDERWCRMLETLGGLYFASGSGRNWICTARGFEPLPPSISHGTRSPLVLHSPRPFQPAFASSMRPSRPLAKKPIGYGMRNMTICPSLSATKPSLRLAVEIGTFSPRPNVLC